MKVKITGLRYTDNIRQTAELEPDYLGFIFYENSNRFVGKDFVMPVLNTKANKVGVFINAAEEYIFSMAQLYQLDLIQLQGNEDPDFCKKISERYPVIKAFGVNMNFDLNELEPFKKSCRFFLFDNKTENFGGIAEPFNWDILKKYDNSVPYFIAAGMDHERLKLLRGLEVKPYGIDITNRLEIKPGYKDIIRLIRLKNDIRHF